MPVTIQRDLRTGRPLWLDRRLPNISVQPLKRKIRCDVLVVGAGISGSIIAESLSDAGLSTVIVDRRGPVRGSTPASTALLQYEIDTPLTHLSDRIGLDRAERLWRRSRLAVDALRERTRALGIKAQQASRDSLYLSGNVLNGEGLAREADARRARVLRSASSNRRRFWKITASRAGQPSSDATIIWQTRACWRQAI